MRRIQDHAYVLRTHPLGDADLIVSLLTRDHGAVRGVARSARRSRRRFGGTLEPLTRVQAAWVEREGSELHRIESLECTRSFASMQAEPAIQAVCASLVEVVSAFTHAGQSEHRGFRLLGAVLEALEGGAEPWIALRYFEFWTLKLHGLLPGLERCAVCGETPPERVGEHGEPACGGCLPGGGRRILRRDRELLDSLRREAPASLPDGARAARPGGAVEALLRGTLESFAERRFRSYRHLRAVMELLASEGGRS